MYSPLRTGAIKARKLARRFRRHQIKRQLRNRLVPTFADERIAGYSFYPVPVKRRW